MRIYFLSSIPCALYIGGAYLGTVSDFERFVTVELADALPVRFEPTGALPITCFLDEQLPFTPPERCEVYRLKDGLALYAKDFLPLDFTLRPIAQKREGDCLATVFSQGEIQLSVESVNGVFTSSLPSCFKQCEVDFKEGLILLSCEGTIALFNQRGEELLCERVLSYSVENGRLNAVLPLSDRYGRTARCVYELKEDSVRRVEYTLSQGREHGEESLLAYAFFESVRIGAPFEEFLSSELRQKANELTGFLGEFCYVLPTEEESVCALVYQKAPRLFETREFTVTVQEGKITDIQG